MESNQTREPWNKGKLVGQKPPLKPKDIWAIRIHLQNEHQVRDLAMFNLAIEQAAWLRSSKPACSGRDARQPDIAPCDGRAAKDPTSSAIRIDRADQVRRLSMDRNGEFEDGALSVPESPDEITSYFYSPVRPDRASVGCRHRTRFDGLWHAHDATDQGDIDLQANQEPKGRPTLARSYQTGEHRSIPWNRGR